MDSRHKAELLKKKALDALLEMINDSEYATHQHHSDPDFTTQTGKDYAGRNTTEPEEGLDINIPPQDLHYSADEEQEHPLVKCSCGAILQNCRCPERIHEELFPEGRPAKVVQDGCEKCKSAVQPHPKLEPPEGKEDAAFFKESDPAMHPVEAEREKHEFFKRSLPEYEMARKSSARPAYITKKAKEFWGKPCTECNDYEQDHPNMLKQEMEPNEQFDRKEPPERRTAAEAADEQKKEKQHEQIVAEGGGLYVGTVGGLVWFNSPATHGTLALEESLLTPEAVRKEIRRSDAAFAKENVKKKKAVVEGWDKPYGYNGGTPEIKPHMYRGYSDGSACYVCGEKRENEIHQNLTQESHAYRGYRDGSACYDCGKKQKDAIHIVPKTAEWVTPFCSKEAAARAKQAYANVPDPGEYDFEHEEHVREEMKQWAQYAEEKDNTADIKPFDPAGQYLCGTCDMRRGTDDCMRVEGLISFDKGSCRLYHLGIKPETAPSMDEKFTKEEAKYSEHAGGFGCKRCEYGTAAMQPDPEGRQLWCSFWGTHVVGDACCSELDSDDEKDEKEEEARKELKTGAAKQLYHVTYTAKVPDIQKQGILPLQTSNWVKAENKERYGEGEIFAFDHPEDAIRWAAKMDWEFNKEMGSGKISIIVFKPGKEKWEIDTADPLSQGGAKGHWLKAHAGIKPEQIIKAVPVDLDMTRAVVQGKPVKLAGAQKEKYEALDRRWGPFYQHINAMADRDVTLESCKTDASTLREFAAKLAKLVEESPEGGLFGDAFIDFRTVSRHISVVLERLGIAETYIERENRGRLDTIRTEIMNAGDSLQTAFNDFASELYYLEKDRRGLTAATKTYGMGVPLDNPSSTFTDFYGAGMPPGGTPNDPLKRPAEGDDEDEDAEKVAAVEFHDAPKLKPPQEQFRKHLDVDAEKDVMEGVMDGVKQPLNAEPPRLKPRREQIDPSIKGDPESLLMRQTVPGMPQIASRPLAESQSDIHQTGGWITPRGKCLALENVALPNHPHPDYALHEDSAEDMGFESNEEARQAGAIRIAVALGRYLIEVFRMTPSIRQRIREFLSEGPSRFTVIEWYSPKHGYENFKNSEEAIDWLENRTMFASKNAAEAELLPRRTGNWKLYAFPPDVPRGQYGEIKRPISKETQTWYVGDKVKALDIVNENWGPLSHEEENQLLTRGALMLPDVYLVVTAMDFHKPLNLSKPPQHRLEQKPKLLKGSLFKKRAAKPDAEITNEVVDALQDLLSFWKRSILKVDPKATFNPNTKAYWVENWEAGSLWLTGKTGEGEQIFIDFRLYPGDGMGNREYHGTRMFIGDVHIPYQRQGIYTAGLEHLLKREKELELNREAVVHFSMNDDAWKTITNKLNLKWINASLLKKAVSPTEPKKPQEPSDEARQAFMKQDYLLQEAQDRNCSMDELWNEIGNEYTNEFLASLNRRGEQRWHRS